MPVSPLHTFVSATGRTAYRTSFSDCLLPTINSLRFTDYHIPHLLHHLFGYHRVSPPNAALLSARLLSYAVTSVTLYLLHSTLCPTEPHPFLPTTAFPPSDTLPCCYTLCPLDLTIARILVCLPSTSACHAFLSSTLQFILTYHIHYHPDLTRCPRRTHWDRATAPYTAAFAFFTHHYRDRGLHCLPATGCLTRTWRPGLRFWVTHTPRANSRTCLLPCNAGIPYAHAFHVFPVTDAMRCTLFSRVGPTHCWTFCCLLVLPLPCPLLVTALPVQRLLHMVSHHCTATYRLFTYVVVLGKTVNTPAVPLPAATPWTDYPLCSGGWRELQRVAICMPAGVLRTLLRLRFAGPRRLVPAVSLWT